MLDILKAILYGIVEGISEWLPISSTGHLIVLDGFLHMEETYPDFWPFFLVVIQLGAILAIVVNFFSELNPFSFKKTKLERNGVFKTWWKIILGVLPCVLVALPYEIFDLDKIFDTSLAVSLALILYGVVFIFIEKINIKNQAEFELSKKLGLRHENEKYCLYETVEDLDYKTVLLIGCAQILSLIPGTSRSGVTIMAALLLGASRSCGAKFSFYLSLPVMVGASALKLFTFMKTGITLDLVMWEYLIIGCAVAFLVSLLVINTLMKFIKKHTFIGFGYYRIALGALILILLFAEVIH